MKTTKISYSLKALVIFAAISLVSCTKDEDKVDPPVAKDIIEVASSNDNFSILVSAIQKADLVTALKGSGPFTVFAPTNEAFNDLLSRVS